MDWSGVDYCDVFISCSDSHSDGTHSLQSIHCWASDAMLHFSKSDEETNSSTSWMVWGGAHFQQMLIFGTFQQMLTILPHFGSVSTRQAWCNSDPVSVFLSFVAAGADLIISVRGQNDEEEGGDDHAEDEWENMMGIRLEEGQCFYFWHLRKLRMCLWQKDDLLYI